MTSKSVGRLAIGAFLLVAVAGVLLRPLLPVDETRYLAVAWEMWLSGDYLVPTKNFHLYTHKPPLLFWLINLVWAVTGVSEVAARLVAPVAATLAVWLTGRLASRLWPDDDGIGTRAVLALAGMLLFAVSGGLTMFDTLLTLAVVAAMTALVAAVRTRDVRWWVAVGAAIGLGVLAKGPVVLFHTIPAILAVPFWAAASDRMTPVRLVGRLAIVLATALVVVGVWLVPAIVAGGPEYRDAVLWTQSAGRMTQSFAHARPWWFFAALLPVILFPWILVPAIWRAGFRARWSEPGLRLAVTWGLSAFVLFSVISGKQIHYLIPELPAVALVVARLSRGLTFRPLLAAIPVMLLAAVAIAASAGLLPMGELDQMLRPTSALLAWGILALGLAWIALQVGGLRGTVVLTLGTILSLNLLIAVTESSAIFDTHAIAAILSPRQATGIASFGQTYHAEFNFAGRFTLPVATPATLADLGLWAAEHPDGVILARPDRTAIPWDPRDTVLFRNSPYSIWHVADAPATFPEPTS